jgi:hypothetical protein
VVAVRRNFGLRHSTPHTSFGTRHSTPHTNFDPTHSTPHTSFSQRHSTAHINFSLRHSTPHTSFSLRQSTSYINSFLHNAMIPYGLHNSFLTSTNVCFVSSSTTGIKPHFTCIPSVIQNQHYSTNTTCSHQPQKCMSLLAHQNEPPTVTWSSLDSLTVVCHKH